MDREFATVENQMNGTSNGGFLKYASVLVRWWRFVVVNVVVVTVVAAIVSFVLPKWYRATASILPPKDQGSFNLFGGSGSVLKGLSSLSKLGGVGQNSGAYNYLAILKSRSAMEAVVSRFDLRSVYGIDDSSIEKAVKQLKENVEFEFQDDDYLTIVVNDKDPLRAADVANYFVELLNTMSIKLATQEARNNREFIENRVAQVRDSLRMVEDALAKYQERSGMMLTPEQTSTISALAELYAMKAKKEIEAAILERTVTSDNAALQQVHLELHELDKKLGTIPKAGLESFRMYRDVVTEQKILEVLVPLYEQAKINEQKDVPVLLVLDKAVPPERKVKPQRTLIVVLAAGLSLFLSIVGSFVLHGFATRSIDGNAFELRIQTWSRRIAAKYRVRFGF